MSIDNFWKKVEEGVPGALPKATRVVKCNSTESARYPDGTKGAIIGSYGTPEEFYYIVRWDGADTDDGGIVVKSECIKEDN